MGDVSRFAALARASSHLPATLGHCQRGSSHHRSTHRIPGSFATASMKRGAAGIGPREPARDQRPRFWQLRRSAPAARETLPPTPRSRSGGSAPRVRDTVSVSPMAAPWPRGASPVHVLFAGGSVTLGAPRHERARAWAGTCLGSADAGRYRDRRAARSNDHVNAATTTNGEHHHAAAPAPASARGGAQADEDKRRRRAGVSDDEVVQERARTLGYGSRRGLLASAAGAAAGSAPGAQAHAQGPTTTPGRTRRARGSRRRRPANTRPRPPLPRTCRRRSA